MAGANGYAVKNTAAISIGNKGIPAILLGPVAVTRDNVKQNAIRDGLQNLEMI